MNFGQFNHRLSHALLLALLFYCFILIFVTPVRGDEIKYHYPSARNFSLKEVVSPESLYSSAYGPIPYLLGSILLKIYDSIHVLRLLNYLIVMLLAFFLLKIGEAKSNEPALFALVVISNPYLLKSAFTYHMFNYGLLFTIVGVYFFFFSKINKKLLVSHIAFGLAVLSQQWMIVVVLSVFLIDLFRIFARPMSLFRIAKNVGLKIIVLLPALCLFLSWRGLTHPNFQSHALHPSFEHLTGTLANWGFIAGLIVLFHWQSLLKRQFVPMLFLFPLLYLSIPEHSMGHGIHVITGGIAQLSTQIQNHLLIPYDIILFIFSVLGLLSIILIIRKRENLFEQFLKYSLIGFLAAFVSSSRLSSSHVFLSIPFLIMIFNNEILEQPILKYGLVAQCYIISLFYVSYYAFVVAQGMSI